MLNDKRFIKFKCEKQSDNIKFKDNDSLSGKVLSVGPVTTQLENDEGDHLNIPNSSLMSGIVESKSKTLIEEDETA